MSLRTNFIEGFLKTNPTGNILSNFSISQLGTKVSGLSSLLPVVNEIKAKLANRVQLSSELVPALLHSYDFIPDLSEVDPILENNDPEVFINEIDFDSFNTLYDSFRATQEFGQSTSDTGTLAKGFSIVDQTGRAFEFIDQSGLVIDGAEVYLSTTQNPVSLEDALIFKKNGKYYINTLLRSKGYWRSHMVAPENVTYRDYISAFLDWMDIPSVSFSLNDMLCDIQRYYGRTVYSSINRNLQDLCENFDLEYESTDDNMMLLQKVTQYAIDQDAQHNYGIVKFYGDVVSDLAHADTINTVLLTAAQLVSNGKFKIESFTQAVAEYTKNATVSVQKVMSGISAAYASGGIYGVAKYIINFISKGTNIAYSDENGVFQFTDNSTLVPNEYIAGLVCNIVGAVISIIGIIASIFSRVVGIAVTLLGTAVMQIPKLINYDYETATWAGLNSNNDADDTQVVLPYFPHGMYQGEMPINQLESSLKDVVNDGSSFFMLSIPGGAIFIGPSDRDGYIRYEYHPALCHLDMRQIYSSGLELVQTYAPSDPDHKTGAYIIGDLSPNLIKIDLDTINRVWNNAKPLNISIDSNNLISNELDDARVRLSFMQSLLLTSLFIGRVVDGVDYNPYYFRNYTVVYSFINCLGGSADLPWIPMYNITHDKCTSVAQEDEWSTINALGYCGFINQENLYDIYHKQLFSGYTLASSINQRLYDNIWTNGLKGGLIPEWNEIVTICNASNSSRSIRTVGFSRNSVSTQYYASGWMVMRYSYSGPSNIMQYGNYEGSVCDIPERFIWAISTPKYNRSTFMLWVVLAALVALAVTVTTIIVSVKVRKSIRQKQAINGAKVEKAWNDFTSDPTAENYKAYKSTVFKTNMFATITGGTKYSKSNYWDGDPSTSGDESTSGIISSVKSSINNDEQVSEPLMKLAAINGLVNDVSEDISDMSDVEDDSNTRIRATEENIEDALSTIQQIRRILKPL